LPLKRFRKNDEIRLPEIFLVDEKGEKIGNISTEKAKTLAKQRDLDLVEVSPNVRPPVCRLMDFGTFLFEQKKKDKLQRKAKKSAETKGVRFGIRISQHDFDVKLRAARKFLEKGHPIKATLQFRGREIVHDELGFKKMTEFKDALADISRIDQEPKRQGRQINMMLMPQKTSGKKRQEEDDE
jgi:translation initiation factor IF-3